MKPLYILLMGVSGTGKTTIGELLSTKLNLTYLDADDFHPTANIEKMAKGVPLEDEDRWPWLDKIMEATQAYENQGFILGCSALKDTYREYLKNGMKHSLKIVFLEGSFDLIQKRLTERKGHFFKASMLKSQLETLEIPENAFVVNIEKTPEEICSLIIQYLHNIV